LTGDTKSIKGVAIASDSEMLYAAFMRQEGESLDEAAPRRLDDVVGQVMRGEIEPINEPFEYLMYMFEHLPAATTVEELEALLPWNVKAVLQKRKEEKQAQERREQQKTAAA
jgi:IS66 C-terminal element